MISRYLLLGLLAINLALVAEEIPVKAAKNSKEISAEILAELAKIKKAVQDSVDDSKSGIKISTALEVLAQYEKTPELASIWYEKIDEIHSLALQASIVMCQNTNDSTFCKSADQNREKIQKFEIKYGLYKVIRWKNHR